MGLCQISTPIDGSLVFGREHEKKKIIDMLLSDDCNNRKVTIICIVANSGIGKTTILQLVNNEESVSDGFDKRIYVPLSMNCDEKRLIKEIIESLFYSPCDITELKTLEKTLMDELMDKKFLLLLDGVEEGNQSLWDKLLMLLNVAANGSAVLVTTNRMEVADVTGATRCYQLECLSNEYCWQLFQNQTFFGHDPNAYPNLVKIGERLVRKCENNTLCIKMLSGLLRHSVTEEWWRAVSVSDLWDMYTSGEEMVLRVCYEFLPPHLKLCLTYCSLFPKNYIFSKHHLVRLWLSQGLIEPMEGNHDLEDIGFLYFDELCNRSYFQHSPQHDGEEDKFLMHELNHDLAQYSSKSECFRFEDSLQIVPEIAPHFSIVPFEYQTVSLNLITNARALQSFLVINRYAFQRNNTISPILGVCGLNDVFVKSSNLKTLDLSNSSIKELPDSIALLRNLHYLGLNNTKIKAIPAGISKLIHLLTLDLKCCNNLVELPDSIELLTNLHHLDATKRDGFVCMPSGIGKLINLQSLAAFNVGSEEMHCGIAELKYLERLKGSLCISQLENVTGMSQAREANMKTKGYLQTLSLQWSNNIAYTDDDQDADLLLQQEVIENLGPNHNLQELIIRNYAGSKFPIWIGDPSFSKLVSVVLDGCPNCDELPACGELPSLRYLSLQKFYGIKRIEASKFPSLERLKLWEMYDLEDWVEIGDGDFPCLRSLSVKRCPLLRKVPRFPSLVELTILYCAQLFEIPEVPSLESLKIEGLQKIKRLNLPENLIVLKKIEITRCSELLSLGGLSKITTLKKLKITQCPKLDVGNWRPNQFPRLVKIPSPTSIRPFLKVEGIKSSGGLVRVHAAGSCGTAMLEGLKDGRDDSGRFSTDSPRFVGASRSSSRVSDLEDGIQFLSKALHAILSSRIPHIHPPSGRQLYRKRDRWFHLALGDLPLALDDPSGLLPQGVTEPLIIDVLLSPRDDPTLPEAIIERWVAQCEIPPPWSALHSPAETSSNSFLVKRTYKKSIILLRSIYSVLRLLPAHRIFKLLRASNQSYNYDLSYRISSFAEPFSREEESDLRTHCFAPVETQSGQLAVSVQYRPCLSSFNLEISSLLPPMLIADYVGSPAADPMRAFPSSPSPSNSSLLHHSTSAPHRFLHEPRPSSSAPASAPLFPGQNSFDNPANRLLPPQHRKSAFSFDEYKLSPPFYLSPFYLSPTPSPPTFSSSSYMQSRLRSETAPVSMKSGISNPGFRSPVSSDPARNFLPPPFPRRSLTLLDPSGQDSFRKAEGLKISDVLSNVYGGSGSGSATPKGLKDGRDDSGMFSSDSPRFGGASRSLSRISDLEDTDFSYPFSVDDVDSHLRFPVNRVNEELGQNATSSSLKSQGAAVAALIRMLKNASPLRDSTSFLSCRASDALDELTSYKEIKEMLIRQGKSK